MPPSISGWGSDCDAHTIDDTHTRTESCREIRRRSKGNEMVPKTLRRVRNGRLFNRSILQGTHELVEVERRGPNLVEVCRDHLRRLKNGVLRVCALAPPRRDCRRAKSWSSANSITL